MSKRVGICEDCGHDTPIGLSHTGPAAPCSECGGHVDILMRTANGEIPHIPKDYHHHDRAPRKRDNSVMVGLVVGAGLLVLAGGLWFLN